MALIGPTYQQRPSTESCNIHRIKLLKLTGPSRILDSPDDFTPPQGLVERLFCLVPSDNQLESFWASQLCETFTMPHALVESRPLLPDNDDGVRDALINAANAAAMPKSSRSNRHRNVAASPSFFGMPLTWSSGSLRSRFNLPATPPPGTIDWVSIFVVYWVILVSEASRGLMLPSTWPYLASLGGGKAMLGVFVATFSLGRMATTIPLGYLSDKYSTSAVLTTASIVQIIGHAMYALAPTVWALLVARIVVGFGSATMSICRAHLTRAVPSNMRTHHFAYLSALQFVGFAVLPGAGGLLAALPEKQLLPGFVLNGFTYPAWTLVFCNFLAIFLIYAFYLNPPTRQEVARAATAAAARTNSNYGSAASNISVPVSESGNGRRRADLVALVVCLLINVSFRGIVAELETVCTPFLQERFNMGYAESSYYITGIGFLGFFVYIGFKPIAQRFSDRNLVMAGLGFVMLGAGPLSMSILTRHMSKWAYVACIAAMWSISYPIGQTAVLALFSKVLADLPAGGFLGVFSATGSLARIVFAMLAGKTWSVLGREAVFACILGYIVPAILLCIFFWKRLVPAGEADDD